jgi:hypothetical protein
MLSLGSSGRFEGNGVATMEDNELEEGEACFYQEEDPNCDPDVAFSYIDIKLQDVLGHFQKEFEGGVSAENLGSKFGGYGSFLPTHQRSPSVLLQPKTPAIVQHNSTQKTPNEVVVERMRSTSASTGGTVPSTKPVSAATNVSSGLAASAADIAKSGEMAVTAVKGSREISPLKKDSIAKNINMGDQKRLKLRFKMGSDSVPRSKNSAIYSGLGLENSPSPSLEDSPDDGQEFSPDNESTPSPSPLSIIQIMTSHQIPGGSLLTPLRDFLSQFSEIDEKICAKEPENLTVKTEFQEDPSSNRNGFESVKDFQVSKENKRTSSGNKRKYKEIKEPDNELGKNATTNLKLPKKSSSKDSYNGRQEREIMGESEKENPKGFDSYRKAATEAPKDKILRADILKDEHNELDENKGLGRIMKTESAWMPVSVKQTCKERVPDQVKEVKNVSGHKDLASHLKKTGTENRKDRKTSDRSKDRMGTKERHGQKDATNETSKDRASGKGTSDEMAGRDKEHENQHGSASKKKQKDMHRDVNSSKEASKEKSRDHTRESYRDPRKRKYVKDSLTTETFGVEGMKVRKESKHASSKDHHRDYVKEVGQEQNGTRKDPIDAYHKDSTKESRSEPFEKGVSRVSEKGREREHSLTKAPSFKKLDHSEAHVSTAIVPHSLAGVPMGTDAGLVPQGVPMGTDAGLVPQVPVVIKENWVMCDACEKWRLLPYGVDSSKPLPKKWFCWMLDWLPEMNRCEISEDATTQALNAMYGIQPGQGQVEANKEQLQLPGAPHSEPVLDIKQSEPIQDVKALKPSVISSNGKKEQVTMRPSNSAGSMNHSNSLSKKSKQSSVKSKSLNDVVQQPLEKVQAGTSISHQAIKGNDAVVGTLKSKQQEKWKLKQNTSDKEGDGGQGKCKNESEPEVHKPLKKIKARVAIDGSNGELSTVPRESSKSDNLHGALMRGVKPFTSNGVTGRDPEGAVAASPIRREHGQAAGSTALKEAKDLKHTADRLKTIGGSDHEITGLYFQAALKFLHGASLLEPYNADNAKHGEITQAMKVYTDTAKLFEFCALTYERNKEMAAAALAYKCMGIAHMRVVLSKTSCLTRDWHELRAAFQTAPVGESPSSSASDVDNLNNHALMDKNPPNPAKIDGSPQVAGNHIIAARHRPNFLRVLQYTHDVSAGMEALRKSESAFSAAVVSLPDGNNGTEGISAVKRVIDFSFHDIDGLLRLVRLAMEAIED